MTGGRVSERKRKSARDEALDFLKDGHDAWGRQKQSNASCHVQIDSTLAPFRRKRQKKTEEKDLIELQLVRSPGFEKESAVMRPLIRPEREVQKKVKDSLQYFFFFSFFLARSLRYFCWGIIAESC